MLATFDPRAPEEETVESWLPIDNAPDYIPPTIGYFVQGFQVIDYLYIKDVTTSGGALTIELKEVFVPVKITWKHYTQSKSGGVTTSTDESIVLSVSNVSKTWPLGTFTEVGVTDGEWDGDFKLYEIV